MSKYKYGKRVNPVSAAIGAVIAGLLTACGFLFDARYERTDTEQHELSGQYHGSDALEECKDLFNLEGW